MPFDHAQLYDWSDAVFTTGDEEPYALAEPWICAVCHRPSCEGTHMILPDDMTARIESSPVVQISIEEMIDRIKRAEHERT